MSKKMISKFGLLSDSSTWLNSHTFIDKYKLETVNI